MSKLTVVAEPGKQEVILTREFNAPRELVFKAYTDPVLVARWWGTSSSTTSIDNLEARPGGQWRFVERDPEGNEFAFHGVYHDLVAPERIVQTFEYEGMPGHVLLETVTFEDLGGRTKVVGRSVFQSVEDRDGMVAAGMEFGAEEGNLALDELLATL
ncbi:MAG: SRPBCC family protein [Candidatus Promineofilum sp.]|nr:SRPBCC family protein [Promineifilum sp.]